MNRLHVALLTAGVALAISSAGCNPPACGPGTVQHQAQDGSLSCIPATAVQQTTKCDPNETVVVAGVCVSKTICGQNTMPTMAPDGSGRILCVGTGTGDDCPVALAPGPTEISIKGKLYDWETGQPLKRKVRFAAYEPLGFLANPSGATPLQEDTNERGCYAFSKIPRPGSGLIAVGTDDAMGEPDELNLAASGATLMVAGKTYELDLYAVKKSTLAAYGTQSGVNYLTAGAYMPCYCNSTLSDPSINHIDDCGPTMRVAGVQVVHNGSVAANAKYLDNATTVNPALTSTVAFGCAVHEPSTMIDTYSGMGGGTWPTTPGASARGVVFIARFHKQ